MQILVGNCVLVNLMYSCSDQTPQNLFLLDFKCQKGPENAFFLKMDFVRMPCGSISWHMIVLYSYM